MRFYSWRLSVVVGVILGVVAGGLRSADAATLTVTDLGDSGAPGQLRTLINAAAPGDTINIPAGTITLAGAAGGDANAGGDLDINKDLTIQGSGAGVTILDGGGFDRVVDISSGATVSIAGMTIRNENPGGASDGVGSGTAAP